MTRKQDSGESFVYRLAFWSGIAMLVIIPAQILVFSISPMPESVYDWFTLFQTAPVAGFFHADLFILVNNILVAIIYLAFYQALKDINKGAMQVALVLGFIGIAAYLSSNRAFELRNLASRYATALSETEKTAIAGAGMAMLAGWQGTAFDAYYVLNGITLLIISVLLFRSDKFSRKSAIMGLAAAILMTVPSTAGSIGLVFSLLSLVPWYIFTIQFSRVFRRLGREAQIRI